VGEIVDPILVVAGTRPEVIKLSPIIKQLRKLKVDVIFVWSGQHYDYRLSDVFFEELHLPKPDINLNIRSGGHSVQTAKAMVRLDQVISKSKPSLVVAEGDTNTVVATALSAIKSHVPFAHVEAGLRSYDRSMPEEVNRIVADTCSELLFAPTELAVANLEHEGIPSRKIRLTGNTIVDVVVEYKQKAKRRGIKLLEELKVSPDDYLLITLHRQENTDFSTNLLNIMRAVSLLSERYKVVFPMHPRTRNRLQKAGFLESLKRHKNLFVIPPQGYLEFLGLLLHSLAVLTDSGGVQEEALTLGVPTVTLRYNTERPETVLYRINVLAGTDTENVIKLTQSQVQKSAKIRKISSEKPNPFGEGDAGKKIAIGIKNAVEAGVRVETSDTRKDPYIIYKLIDSVKLQNISKYEPNEFEVIAVYDSDGRSIPKHEHFNYDKKTSKILVRMPLSMARELQ
jgi:UDP-N-acetylglucosamine 2-epimerase (non-hydrolysing)